MKLTGGLSQNPLLNTIKSDVTGMTLLALRDHEVTTLGAASIVGRALGWYADDREAAAALLAVDRSTIPIRRTPACTISSSVPIWNWLIG